MDKYVRKVVHLELKNNNICQLEKKLVAYYKMEKRNGRIKITLSVDGVKFLSNELLYFCLIIKEGDTYKIKKIKPVIVKANRIEDVYYINDVKIENIKGCLILDGPDSPYDVQKIAFAGFQDENINLNLLRFNAKIEGNDKTEVNTITAEIKSVKPSDLQFNKGIEAYEKSKKEINNQEGQRAEAMVNKDLNKEIKINHTADKNHNQAKPAVSLFKKEDEVYKNNKENDNGVETTSNNEYQNTPSESGENTIEYIKKQLELKEETGVIDDLFNKNQRLIPFEFKEDQTEWVKIDITDLVFLPLESWMLINNAFLMTCYRKYKHLILGRNLNERTLKLGIPDIYYFKESLVANVCGFNEFYPCSGCPPKAGEYGYWIIQTDL